MQIKAEKSSFYQLIVTMERTPKECKTKAKQYRRNREWLKAAVLNATAQSIIFDRRTASLRKSVDVSLGIVKRAKTVASP